MGKFYSGKQRGLQVCSDKGNCQRKAVGALTGSGTFYMIAWGVYFIFSGGTSVASGGKN